MYGNAVLCCRWLVINTALADTITAFMRSSLREHSRRAASFSFSHQNDSISPISLDQQCTPWACHAEDVLGAFFGRHRHMRTAMQPAFGGQSKQHQSSAPDINQKFQTALRPSDSASSLLAACASNIVPLPHQRMHGNQFSASPAGFTTLVGCQPGSPTMQLLLQQADEPHASQLMQLRHPLSPKQSSQQPKGYTQRGVLSKLRATAHSHTARCIDSADQIPVHRHGEPLLLQASIAMLSTFTSPSLYIALCDFCPPELTLCRTFCTCTHSHWEHMLSPLTLPTLPCRGSQHESPIGW